MPPWRSTRSATALPVTLAEINDIAKIFALLYEDCRILVIEFDMEEDRVISAMFEAFDLDSTDRIFNGQNQVRKLRKIFNKRLEKAKRGRVVKEKDCFKDRNEIEELNQQYKRLFEDMTRLRVVLEGWDDYENKKIPSKFQLLKARRPETSKRSQEDDEYREDQSRNQDWHPPRFH
ncbi:hypothetical protein VTL71DRAFT_9734 [Oculimacula yallundae]|uniref:Uncharacterized protein n=1 Tax=Oculimacula yallundae TaxID=86028 RepID=A0ABR4BRQ3_9HELO